METFSINKLQDMSFHQARSIAESEMADHMRSPIIVSWFNHCSGKGSIDQEGLGDCDPPWETYGKVRGGVRVDVGECYSFVVGDTDSI